MTINNGVSPVVFWRDLGFVLGAIGLYRRFSSGSIANQLVNGGMVIL
jgi:hypothetical protein